jgi:D-alanyl-D-alanine carboxypeptidase
MPTKANWVHHATAEALTRTGIPRCRYTEASGYNLVSSVRRDEKHIVAVVLGGTSNAARDARMRELIEDHISLASTQRTVPMIVEAKGQHNADGGWALYLAAQRLKDDRWRYQSPSRIARFYGNLGWKGTDAEVHLVASEANNFFGALTAGNNPGVTGSPR